MENKEVRIQLNDEEIEQVIGGVLIRKKTVTNKDTGEVYQLLVDPMTAFTFATANGKKSDSEIIALMLANHYIK